MMTNRIKAQGKRLKVKGSRFFPCTLHLAPCFSHLASPAVQRGFSLVTAIFLLVVIAALGTFAVTLSTTQHQSAAMDVMGSRAYQAAHAGIEWAAFQVVNSPLNAASAVTCATILAPPPLGGTLAPFAVTVTCAAASHVEDTSTVWIYDVSAVANAGTLGGPDYVERVISVKMGK